MKSITVLAALLLSAAGLFAGPVLTISPLTPGQNPGWGFTLTNDTGVAVVTQAVATLPMGFNFTDLISTWFVPVGVDSGYAVSTWSQPFDFATGQGLGYLSVAPDAPAGPVSGNVTVFYDLYRHSPDNPAFQPDSDAVGFGFVLNVPVTFDLTQAPEPAPVLMVILGGFLLFGAACCRPLTRHRTIMWCSDPHWKRTFPNLFRMP